MMFSRHFPAERLDGILRAFSAAALLALQDRSIALSRGFHPDMEVIWDNHPKWGIANKYETTTSSNYYSLNQRIHCKVPFQIFQTWLSMLIPNILHSWSSSIKSSNKCGIPIVFHCEMVSQIAMAPVEQNASKCHMHHALVYHCCIVSKYVYI